MRKDSSVPEKWGLIKGEANYKFSELWAILYKMRIGITLFVLSQ